MLTDDHPTARFVFDARVPMRDGVELSVDVYLPDRPGPTPAVLHRTPYDNANPALVETARYFAARGYAFVAADVRGRGDSDGAFRPFRGEGPDGYDTIEWIAQQPWCDGAVGMMGGSYAASVQWWAARERPPHLRTMVSSATSGLWVQEPQQAGKLRPSMLVWLHVVAGHTLQPGGPADADSPIDWPAVLSHRPYHDADKALGRTNTAWREWMANLDDAGHWAEESPFHGFDRIDIPVLHITGWFDGSIHGELRSYAQVRRHAAPRRGTHRLLIGPWDHPGTRKPARTLHGVDFTDAAVYDVMDLHVRWFDQFLRGVDSGVLEDPPVSIFTLGTNTWQHLPAWPPPDGTTTEMYLHSAGHANGAAGDGRLVYERPDDDPPDAYTYDPADATPSGPLDEPRTWGAAPLDRLDHSFLDERVDTLVYTSAPFDDDVEVTGEPAVVLWATTDAPDTDFAATLSVLDPDRPPLTVAEGLVRTSYYRRADPAATAPPSDTVPPGAPEPSDEAGRPRGAHPHHDADVLPADEARGPIEYRIELNAVSLVVRTGQRLRLRISSAEFPAYDRNPNTGASVGADATFVVAHQQVHHTSRRPSRVILPVRALPGSGP